MEKASSPRTAKKSKRPSRVVFVLMTFLLILVLALSAAAFRFRSYAPILDNVFFVRAPEGPFVDSITQNAQAITQDMQAITLEEAEEGIVLLVNRDSALPLRDRKINVFGRGSYYATYGGTGSGAGGTAYTSLYDGLAEAGFSLNPDLVAFYTENAKASVKMGIVGTDFGLYENPASDLPASLIERAKAYSDTAVYVISRVGGEGDDLPLDTAPYYGGSAGRHYLELSTAEESMLELIRSQFGTVIVVLNATNAMELGFLEQENIDAALWTECFGSVGTVALGNLLSGAVNPSGRTSDTFAYAVESNPTYYSFGDYDYTNASYANTGIAAATGSSGTGLDSYHYVKYNEGIYVGYRYYETAAADGFIDYDAAVQFPFGYGLSYTTFSQSFDSVTFDGSTIKSKITVQNTGSVPGKEVVQLYYSAPYTPGGIEKSEVVLGAFAKTEVLGPGESEQVTLTISAEDMASFDYSGIKAEGGAYVLEAGDYAIRLQSDSHHVLDERVIPIEKDRIYNEENDGPRLSDGIAATSRFTDVSENGGVTYLSRADWEGTFPKARAASCEAASEDIVRALTQPETVLLDPSPADWTVQKNGLTLKDLYKAEYDDPRWELLIGQIPKAELMELISTGGWQTAALPSIEKPRYLECDGPNGINNLMANVFTGIKGNMYTNQSTLAKTWNPKLARLKGVAYGLEALHYGVAGIYGPAANIHRSPFSGRNYEYYSEDGLLSGVMAASEMQGLHLSGVYCYFKHFAVNDQETNRDRGGLVTWLNEQALREIYLKGFELGVKGGSCYGIMSSFNRIGTTPTAESSALLNTVLRDEWGFRGAVITDCVMACTTEDIDRATLAGNDFQLSYGILSSLSDKMTGSVSGQKAMRQAAKNILYMIAQSGVLKFDGIYGEKPSVTAIILQSAGIFFLFLFALYYMHYFFRRAEWKKGQNRPADDENDKTEHNTEL